jgi:hypothetical protein
MVERVTAETVAKQYDWVRDRGRVVTLINSLREDFSSVFDTDVDPVTPEQYRGAVDEVFADGDLAVNVAALVAILREVDVEGDYPGFVVDEMLGRELAGAIAGTQPLGTLGEAAFHYVDVTHHPEAEDGGSEEGAGVDDLDAALAAGFQTRMPGWNWRDRDSPFSVTQ